MKSRKNILIFIILLGLTGINCHSWRWHQKSPEKKAEFIAEKVISKLSLDENQAREVERIKTEWIAKHRELKPDSGLQEEFLALVRMEKLDEERLNKLSEKMDSKRKVMHQFTIGKFKEFHSILKQEQKEKLALHIQKMMKKFDHEIE